MMGDGGSGRGAGRSGNAARTTEGGKVRGVAGSPGWTRAAALAGALALAASLLAPTPAAAQVPAYAPSPEVRRPVPGPMVPPPFYRQAVARGTRSSGGAPGEDYWRNHARYSIEAELDPATGRVAGSERIEYLNQSPDTLPVLVLHLLMNLHKEGSVRNEAQEITGGVRLERVVVDGRPATEGALTAPSRYSTQATVLVVRPPRPVPPGGTATLEIDWSEVVPQASSGRVGWSDREVYFVGYWFPKMAVYDDLRGWDAEPYLGNAEFYDEFGDYDVSLTVPAGWTVMATGELQNPGEVWSERTRRRLAAAATADTIVHVATRADRTSGGVTAPGTGGRLTYRFAADTVRDFTFTASNTQLWDATSALVPGRPGDGAADRVLIHGFWRDTRAPLWAEQALYAKHAIEHHSRYTGFAYPWPHMTSVEGDDIIGGGMEFPMLTVMGTYTQAGAHNLYNVTAHELAHMWIPMIVGSNEKRYAWMDEGSTSFLENHGRPEYWPGDDADGAERDNYVQVARAEAEQPLLRHGDYYEPGPGYGTASYAKPATLLVTLRNLLGEPTFERAYRTFIAEWAWKHPAPWDLFDTFERVAGTDLDWFWETFYRETWSLDQAVGGVTTRDGHPVVTIEDRGFAPMPARVRIQTTRGGTVERAVPVARWLEGATSVELDLPASVGEVTRVEIDPGHLFPDVDRSNDVWVRPGEDGVRAPGRLVIVGGGLHADNADVYREVLAGRNGDGPVCVLPTASGVAPGSMASAVAALDAHGGPGTARGVFISIENPERARVAAVADTLRGCSGYWFTGGDQSRVVDVFLAGGDTTPAYRAVMDRYLEGAVVAGSSAGAAMMGRRIIASGSSAGALAGGATDHEADDGVWVREGMGFVDGVLLDQHFLARGRVGRLLVAVAAEPGIDTGIGIDENTALVVQGGRGRVVGASGVVVVDASGATPDPDGHGATGLRLALAGAGDVVDLTTLEVTPAADKRPLSGGGPVAVPDDPFARWAFLGLLADAGASDGGRIEVPGDGWVLRLSREPGFRALARPGAGVEGAPAGLSVGPFRVDLVGRTGR